ncbi:hypothetical protein ACFL6X_02240 [Candidatus Latescibacterota bacterium]
MSLSKAEVIETTCEGEGWTCTTNLVPAIHVAEFPKTPGEPVPYRFSDAVTERRKDAHDFRYLHRSPHRNPEGSIPEGFFTAESPRRKTGQTFRSQEMEWEFALQYRERLFESLALSDDSPVEERLAAIAEDIHRNHRHGGRTIPSHIYTSSHPADCLAFKGRCVESGNAFVYMCNLMQVPARTIHAYGHTTSEILLEGRWRFVENMPKWLVDSGVPAMFDQTFAELIEHPRDSSPDLSERFQLQLWGCHSQQYVFPQATGHFMNLGPYRSMCLSPQTAEALYPGQEVTYKNLHADRYQLVSGKPSRRRYEALKLRQGSAFVRRFWLNGLEQTRKLVAYFNGPRRQMEDETPEEHSISESGGDWFIQVNDRQLYLRDMRGTRIEDHSSPSPAVYGPHWFEFREGCPFGYWSLPFELPLADLNENGWNTIGIGNAGSGNEFLWFGETDNAYEPREACLCQVA